SKDKEVLKKLFPKSLKVVILKTSHGIYALSYSQFQNLKDKLKHIRTYYIIELRQNKPKSKPKIVRKQKVIIKPIKFEEFKIPKPPSFTDPKKLFIYNAVVKYIKSNPKLRDIDVRAIDWESEIDSSLSVKENINKIVKKFSKISTKLYKSLEISKEELTKKLKEVWSKYKNFEEFEKYLREQEKKLIESAKHYNYFDIF
ncbi:MAG: hypothetical protein QW184_01915, partial [Nanopusillaceae archaeon]